MLLSYSGRVVVLECFAADICSERSWQKVDSPGLEGISERISCTASTATISTHDICSAIAAGCEGDRFALFAATEGGNVYRIAFNGQTSSFNVHLLPDDAVACLDSMRGGTVIICSSLGQVSMRTTDPGATKLILDDGILQPGPLAQLMDGTFLLAKFNRIYHFSQEGDLITSLQVKDYYLPLCEIIQKDKDSLWVVGKDASCFELNTELKSVLPVKNLPWLASQNIEASLADVEDEVENDDIASEAYQPKISTMPFNCSFVHGAAHGYLRKDSWILITQYRDNPLGPKARLYPLQTQLNSSHSDLAFAVDQAFTHGHQPTPAKDLNFWKISTQACPICRASVAASSGSESIAICRADAGHVFEICAYSGTPIYPLDEARQCHRCGLHIRKMDPPRCPFCDGSLLNARL